MSSDLSNAGVPRGARWVGLPFQPKFRTGGAAARQLHATCTFHLPQTPCPATWTPRARHASPLRPACTPCGLVADCTHRHTLSTMAGVLENPAVGEQSE